MKRLLSAVSCAAALVLAVACSPLETRAAEAVTIPYGANKDAGATFVHDGVTLYYETYGQGEPLLLVHGNGGSIGTLAAQIDHFKAKYRVIAMDSRDQGQSSDSAEPITYEKMTDDLAALIDHLKIGPVDVVGLERWRHRSAAARRSPSRQGEEDRLHGRQPQPGPDAFDPESRCD